MRPKDVIITLITCMTSPPGCYRRRRQGASRRRAARPAGTPPRCCSRPRAAAAGREPSRWRLSSAPRPAAAELAEGDAVIGCHWLPFLRDSRSNPAAIAVTFSQIDSVVLSLVLGPGKREGGRAPASAIARAFRASPLAYTGGARMSTAGGDGGGGVRARRRFTQAAASLSESGVKRLNGASPRGTATKP